MGAAALKAGHSNTIFTVRDIVDDTGAVIQSYEFNEHGIPMPGSGSGTGTFSPKTYQGGFSVNDDRADSGLYLMGHRHYAPDLGRFISRDPIGFAGGLNLFGAAFASNPATLVDPWGLQPTMSICVGSSYRDSRGNHPVNVPYFWDSNTRADVPVIENASSAEFISALESNMNFLYTGHHFGDGTILLSDGRFKPIELFKKARRLPKMVILDACNSSNSLPAPGQFPGTTFVGVNDFIDVQPAADFAVKATTELRQPGFPMMNLNNAVKNSRIPGVSVVGQPPYRYK